MEQAGKLVLIATAVGFCLAGGQTPSGRQSAGVAQRAGSSTLSKCPPKQEIDMALGKASSLLQHEQYQGAVEALETFSKTKCDARIYLLLAAALEAAGDSAEAEDTLQRAHSIWPSSNSVSASLARDYLNAGQVDNAVQALGDFHVTAATPLQEMQMGVVVYLAAHRLVPALALAQTAYKSYPSLNTLLLLANVLQLQGRYKDVNRLLQEQRKAYANSPAFLITFAESENDAMLWEAARDDLEHAIALDNRSYQGHYLLGNVLAALNETDRAESEYRTAIGLAPNQPRTYYQLALLLHAKQDDAGEASLLTQALAVDDHYAPAYCEMGRILMGQHRLGDAVTQLNRAIQYNPQIEQAYYLLARAYAGLGQKDKADAMVKRYTQVRVANRRSSVDQRPGQLGVDQGKP
jgi:tetratricopeptide (TPR) repeat protein